MKTTVEAAADAILDQCYDGVQALRIAQTVLFAAAQHQSLADAATETDELVWLRDQIIELCDRTEDKVDIELDKPNLTEHERGFHRGAYKEAKGIRIAIAEVVRCRLAARAVSAQPPASPGKALTGKAHGAWMPDQVADWLRGLARQSKNKQHRHLYHCTADDFLREPAPPAPSGQAEG